METPSSRAARMTRTAISPRLAIRILRSTAANVGVVASGAPGPRSRPGRGRRVGRSSTSPRPAARTPTCSPPPASRPDRSVLVADHQTAGRGRLDRRWDAPPGANLLVSLLFHEVPEDPGELTRRVGLAAVDACRETTGVDAVLKWPNDVLVGDRKLAGILAERTATGTVVVGLGLNVGWAPPGAAKLGPDVDPLDVLAGPARRVRPPAGGRHRALPPDARHPRPSGPDRLGRWGARRHGDRRRSRRSARGRRTRVR